MKTSICLLFCMIYGVIVFSQDTIILQPGPDQGKDAKVRLMAPDQNLGDAIDLTAHAWTYEKEVNISHSFIEFDLNPFIGGPNIISAKLSLYITSSLPNYPPGQSGDNRWVINRVTETWDEHTITWNNQPAYTDSNQVFLPESTNSLQNYEDIDITGMIRDMVQAPDSNNGLMFKLVVEEPLRAVVFCSSDYSVAEFRPKLQIVYDNQLEPIASFDYGQFDNIIVFYNTSLGGSTYYWDFGDGIFSNEENPQHEFSMTGEYFVCLTATNEFGSSEYCDTVYYCRFPECSFSYSAVECEYSFINNSVDFDSLYWDFGDGNGSFVINPIHAYQDTGNYIVCLKVYNDCGFAQYCDTVNCCKWPVADFKYFLNDREALFQNHSIHYDSVHWDFGDGFVSSNFNPLHEYADYGEYNVCLEVFNECGTDSYCELIKLVSVEQHSLQNNDFVVFPNPCGDIINIGSLNQQINESFIKITDVHGRVVLNDYIDFTDSNNHSLDMRLLPSGAYYIIFSDVKSGISYWQKIIKK